MSTISDINAVNDQYKRHGAISDDGVKLMRLLASAWFSCGWKAETANEREMQEIMERNGFWPIKDWDALMALVDPPHPKDSGFER